MAHLKNSVLKGITGSIGELIIYEVDGATYVRSKPADYKDAKSRPQLNQREKLILINDFLRPFKNLLLKTFVDPQGQKKPYLLAKSYNLKNGTKGYYPNLEIDYSKALICKGSLALPSLVKGSIKEDGILFEWENPNNANKTDTLIVMLRIKGQIYSDHKYTGIERSKKSYFWNFDIKYKAEDIYVWIAFRDSFETEISDSLFVTLTV
ncbi:DUF6266 family protein [Saccharicrinis aurantiacus]|uniref:DUF6266 family protein n=1 Tax=Saccharicrinis aurantiacus TaxID=1849719 RepID=UPI002491A67B|nr:DUF6266 family protein [Saccharicrinis aurantiacus]